MVSLGRNKPKPGQHMSQITTKTLSTLIFLLITNIYAMKARSDSDAFAGYSLGFNYNKTMNIKAQRFDEILYPEPCAGINFGAFINLPIDERWDFQTELHLISKAMRAKEWRYKIKYVELPVFLKVHLKKDNRVTPDLIMGFVSSYSMGADITKDEKSGTHNYYKGEINSFDMAIIAGLGCSILFDSSILFIDVIYSHGMLSTFDSRYNYLDQRLDPPMFNNKTAIIKIGYGLRL